MAANFNDLSRGVREREVVELINEQLLRNGVSSDFYMIQMCQSWGELEAKVSRILSDEAIPGGMKEYCAWSALALATRLAKREKQHHAEKVKKLQEELYEQKLLSRVLTGVVNRLRSTQEREKQKAEADLQQVLLTLQKVEEERDSLRDELLQVLTAQSHKQAAGREGEGRSEDTQAVDLQARESEGEIVTEACHDNTVASAAAAAAAAATAAATAMAATMTQAVSAAVTAAVSAFVPPGATAAALPEVGAAAAAALMAATPAAPAIAPAAIAPAATAPALGEGEADDKVKENDQEITFDFRSDSLRTWSQAGFSHLLCRSEASVSCEPTMFVSGVTGPTAAGPPRKASRTPRKVKQLCTRRFLPERFNPISGFSCSEKPTSQRRVGDWKCDECLWMNFSWRTECFKCRKYRDLPENEGSTPE